MSSGVTLFPTAFIGFASHHFLRKWLDNQDIPRWLFELGAALVWLLLGVLLYFGVVFAPLFGPDCQYPMWMAASMC